VGAECAADDFAQRLGAVDDEQPTDRRRDRISGWRSQNLILGIIVRSTKHNWSDDDTTKMAI
jgi:hypothetical protein